MNIAKAMVVDNTKSTRTLIVLIENVAITYHCMPEEACVQLMRAASYDEWCREVDTRQTRNDERTFGRTYNGVAMIFFWGGHPVHFPSSLRGADRIQWGGGGSSRNFTFTGSHSVGGGGSSGNCPLSRLPDQIIWRPCDEKTRQRETIQEPERRP